MDVNTLLAFCKLAGIPHEYRGYFQLICCCHLQPNTHQLMPWLACTWLLAMHVSYTTFSRVFVLQTQLVCKFWSHASAAGEDMRANVRYFMDGTFHMFGVGGKVRQTPTWPLA